MYVFTSSARDNTSDLLWWTCWGHPGFLFCLVMGPIAATAPDLLSRMCFGRWRRIYKYVYAVDTMTTAPVLHSADLWSADIYV